MIDLDYDEEIVVLLKNVTMKTLELKTGERIAQLILMPHLSSRIVNGVVCKDTNRLGGFGSTGKGV